LAGTSEQAQDFAFFFACSTFNPLLLYTKFGMHRFSIGYATAPVGSSRRRFSFPLIYNHCLQLFSQLGRITPVFTIFLVDSLTRMIVDCFHQPPNTLTGSGRNQNQGGEDGNQENH
jgi:hypothetical protein